MVLGLVYWALNDSKSVPWKDQREQQQLQMKKAEPRLQGWKELGLFRQGSEWRSVLLERWENDLRCVQGDIKKATKIYILLILDFKIF